MLLVDDEADSRDLLSVVLDRCGAQVTSAGSAAEALATLKRERFDAIISDIGMPEENGFALIEKIRELPPEAGGDTPALAPMPTTRKSFDSILFELFSDCKVSEFFINVYFILTLPNSPQTKTRTAACNRLHPIDQRLWSLAEVEARERFLRDEFYLKQEFIAQMLGVHRPTVSIVANILQPAGLISDSRGDVKIFDPEGLKNGACECLEIIGTQFDQIFDCSWREFAARARKKSGKKQFASRRRISSQRFLNPRLFDGETRGKTINLRKCVVRPVTELLVFRA